MKLKYSLLPLLTLCLLVSCSFRDSGKGAQSSQSIKFNKQGINMDANYDPRLDNLIPGYKILTVAVTNNSFDILRLNPLKDKWEVIDARGQKLKAINSLRIKDPSVFTRLPPKVQQMVDYPVGITVGYAETVDLFFPTHVDLNSFRAVTYYNAETRQDFDMLSNLDSPTHVPANMGGLPEGSVQEMDPRFRK